MNPHLHDEFVALSALHHSGELTDEEWALLQVHLAYCDSCRIAFEQYELIANGVLPSLASLTAADDHEVPRESPAEFEAAEQRLMNQLTATPAPQPVSARRGKVRPIHLGLLAASVGLVAVLVGSRTLQHTRQNNLPVTATSAIRETPHQAPLQSQPETRADEPSVATLQAQLKSAQDQISKSSATAVSMEQRLQQEQAQQEELSAARDAASQQLATVQAEAQSLREKTSLADGQIAQQTAHADSLESKIRDLTAVLGEKEQALNDKERILSLDKDFMSHDRDIRDVIGARNLYIADIMDMGENGKAAKPFGRIFYTQDRSLVFYGFDLEKQPGLKQAVAFQAWGSSSDKQTVNLGLFYQDDSHKRWVLRCNDAKALSRLNMVFVTVEPPGGSNSPTGKQLLRAYLQIPPNHP